MARDVIDLPGPEPELAPALAGADRGLRLGLAAAFGLAAALAPEAPWSPPAATFAATALLLACGWLPRLAGLAALASALLALLGGAEPAPWLGVLAAAGVRVRLQWGPAGDHLERVRALRRTRARGVAAMELRRVRAAQLPEDARSAELERAGDAFERAGRARTELRALGIEKPARSVVRYAAPLAEALPPRLIDAALRWLEERPG